MTVIRMWAAVAWADDVLAEAEAEGLRRLIRTADLTDEERATATTFVETKAELTDEHLTDLTPDARRGIYRAACRMAVVDHTLATAERAVLDRLLDLLGIPSEIAKEIESDVPGFAH